MSVTRLSQQASSVPQSDGSQLYTFGSVSQGYAAQVTVSVPDAPAGVLWNAFVSGALVGSTTGSSPLGPIFLQGGDVLSLRGSPPAGTSAGLAVAVGSQGLSGEISPSAPSAGGGQGQTVTLLTTIEANTASATVSPTPTATALIITGRLNQGTPLPGTTLSVTGATTAIPLPLTITTTGSGNGFQAIATLPAGAPDDQYIVAYDTPVTTYVFQTTGQVAVAATITGPLINGAVSTTPATGATTVETSSTATVEVASNITCLLIAGPAGLNPIVTSNASAPYADLQCPVAQISSTMWQAIIDPSYGENYNVSASNNGLPWMISQLAQPIVSSFTPTIAAEALADSSGNNQTLTASSAMLTSSPFGKLFGKAIAFNVTGGSVQGPSGTGSAQGAVTAANWTAEANVFLPSVPGSSATWWLVGRASEWLIGVAESYLGYWVDSSNTGHFISGGTPTPGPHHIALAWSGSNVLLFVDGAQVGFAAITTAVAPYAVHSLNIGNANLDNSVPPGVVFDSVRVSNSLRYGGLSSVAPQAPFLPDASTECLYQFNSSDNSDWSPITWTVSVANPSAGSDWSYTLPTKCKVRGIHAYISTSSGATNRYPLFRIQTNDGNSILSDVLPLTTTDLAGNSVGVLQAAIGAQSVQGAGTAKWSTAPLPDLGALPAGTVLFGLANPVQTGDQWQEIALTFESV